MAAASATYPPGIMDEFGVLPHQADDDEYDERAPAGRRLVHWLVAMVVLLAYAIGFLLIATWLVYRFGDAARELLRNLGTTDG